MTQLTVCFILLLLSITTQQSNGADHAMYVWRDAFDVDAPHCNGIYPADEDGANASCFRHSWETSEARDRLFAASSAGQVTRIFLSDVRNRIRHGDGKNADGVCDPALVSLLSQAHSNNIQVYGLFGVSDAAFSEQFMVGDLNLFNTNCGTTDVYFDGASVNNEHFTSVKDCEDPAMEAFQQTFLDNLANTATNASPLPLHFSVAWNWWCCSCSSGTARNLEWNGITKNALEHMIGIADSVDVQVAWNVGSTMISRATVAYGYWDSTKSPSTAFYVLAYTNPNSDCRLSFAPHTKGATTLPEDCSNGADRTEAGMFAAFAEIQASLPDANGGIHFMDGVYSSGMPGWPQHTTPDPTPDCSLITKRRRCRRNDSCYWVGRRRNGSCNNHT